VAAPLNFGRGTPTPASEQPATSQAAVKAVSRDGLLAAPASSSFLRVMRLSNLD